jgi:hypothetical protein
VSAETGQATATIVLENVIKMYSRMLPSSLSRAIWVTTPEAIPELFTMALSVGTGGGPVMLTNAAGPAPLTIFGRPLVVCEKASRLGTRGDIAFVDLSYYLIGDRQVMSASSSTDFRFQNDQTAFRIIQRVDGRPWLSSAITPQNGGPTLSPFVELEAKDSSGTGAQNLAVVTEYYTNTGNASDAWTRRTQAAAATVVTTATATQNAAVFEVEATQLSDTYKYVKVTSTGAGTVNAVTRDLAAGRAPANLPAMGA